VLAEWGRISSAHVRPPLIGPAPNAVHAIRELLSEGAPVLDPATGTPR
jgi:hypothetical protein